MTRHLVPGEGVIDINVGLQGPMGQRVRREADRRRIRVDVLCALIVERVIRDDMIKAVLDDEK